MESEWEQPPPVYSQLDVTELFCSTKGGVIREVEMEEDSEAESFGEREVVRKQHRKAKGQDDGGETERAVTMSRWELMDDGEADQQRISTRKCQSNGSSQLGDGKDSSKEPEACDLREAIKRAQQKKVRWADEEEEIEGFHIGGNKYQLEEVHYLEGLGPQPDEGNGDGRKSCGSTPSPDPQSFAQMVKAEHMAFKSMRLKGVLKGSSAPRDSL